ncbi:TM0106 family RecB-like putative nuclease [Humibacter ginsenosidimutans]|uniref:TM0106 family RecB-like putative nuclease n=1 Tax=Humibacter ginsenosidimutans TaxID=2599293 RepID=A0A5B8M2P9_9MICO|nr:bifunctional RecB family nuclease/DEAD/DEAH box helicase [Humibacter ginsenosidimutans]QDZ14546.1 TM0106 family RecB-like putative nuclease [Humibacter ginsenosidimutans]
MFLLSDATIVLSPSDLTTASTCEFDFLRRLDGRLGWGPEVARPTDAMLERTSRLGDEHERRVLDRYVERFGEGVARFERPEHPDVAGLTEAAAATAEAFRAGAPVVYQGVFFDPLHEPDGAEAGTAVAFVGYADFIVRESDGRYTVEDTKLARRAKVTALLQVAAYALQLERIGIEPSPDVRLLLGDGSVSTHRLDDILPVYRKRIARLHAIVREHLADGEAVRWGDERFVADGRCDTCAAEVEANRDVLLTAGLRVTQRPRFVAAGIRTIEDLAASSDDLEVDRVAPSTIASLRQQAQLQLAAEAGSPPPVVVYNAPALAALPTPDDGDIFFDFEGDPLYTEGDDGQWGIDYLFGVVQTDGEFQPFWAHTFAEERQALIDFLRDVARRRAEHPGMHIYHYASYERTHLLNLAARHGVGEDEVDDLLRDNVLVDLYPLVRKAIRVGSRSYSIKKLEPLYMGDELRSGEVQDAGTSIEEYATARALLMAGEVEEGRHRLDEIAAYNRYDCVSTLRLRDWLLERAADAGVPIGLPAPEREVPELEPSTLRDDLLARAGESAEPHAAGADATRLRTDDETAAAFAAAALDYHKREQKSFWWAHFARLVDPVEAWANTRDVLVVERAELERDWYRDEGQRSDRRVLRLHGQFGPGSTVKAGRGAYLLYEFPGPFPAGRGDPGARNTRSVTLVGVGDDWALVEETRADAVPAYDTMPSAITPGPPPSPGRQKQAIESWCQSIVDATPEWPHDPVTDLLRRVPPRTRGDAVAQRVEAASDDTLVDAVSRTVADLDDSYLAVQGPPGTGKTYLGAHVIASLVRERHWKIGVVAQSHAVVEHLLASVAATAGLDAELVGKVPQTGTEPDDDCPYTVLDKDGQLDFALAHADSGFVVGGTAWDFANPARVPVHSLDLLVIDEAGQFSLASTAAAAVAARNLLLLGDPQQLPQVSQGLHPEPVDQSALGWISAGHDVLPAELGYFLAQTRRMHPALAAPVSTLSYEGRLRAHPDAATRHLDAVAAGLHPVPVHHDGDSTESPAEAQRVVEIVESVLGSTWREGGAERPLTDDDIIVVTPYNAQLACVHEALAAAGHPQVRVGTVDKFQGREAVLAIVSLAASSAEYAPRGMGFLIMKNRLNVAVSRAKWAAYVVYSPQLTEHLPHRPEGVAELSAFITLVEGTE